MALFSWLTKARSGIKKKTFPCEPSTIDDIHAAVIGAAQGKPDRINCLKRTTCRIPEDQIPWPDLRYFGFLGKEDWQCNHAMEQNGFDPGIYIDRDGTALLLIHQDDALIQPWADRCGDSLQILAVYHAAISGLDVSTLVNLQEVCMFSNRRMSSLAGLKKLTKLTCLYLLYCEGLVDVPGLEDLTQLRTLYLRNCQCVQSRFSLEKLTQLNDLEISYSDRLAKLSGLESLTQLVYLHICECKELTVLSGLEKLVQLTSLNLSGCSRLTALPWLEKLVQLTELDLSGCYMLTALPGLEKLVQLTDLNLSRCEDLTALPGLEKLVRLTSLNLSQCRKLTALPGLEKLVHLTKLDLSVCYRLTELSELEKLVQLNELKLSGDGWTTSLSFLEKLVHLTKLDISGCEELTSLPGLEKLVQLIELNLSDCPKLTVLPGLEKLVHLTKLDLFRCEQLTTLPGLEKLVQLTKLKLFKCSQLTALPGLEKLVHLTVLNLSRCERLTALPDLRKLVQLTELDLSECPQLAALSGLEELVQLTRLNLTGCSQLTTLTGLEKLVQLTWLNLTRCSQLTALPSLEKLVQLETLALSNCSQLTTLTGLEKLVQLTWLNLAGCSRLTTLHGLEKLVQLNRLDLSRCSQLTALPGLEKLVQLTEMSLTGCSQLTALPGLEKLVQLTEMSLTGCSQLTALPGLEKLVQLTKLDLSECSRLTTLPEGIRQMKGLQELNLEYMELTDLPVWIPEIAGRFSLRERDWFDFDWRPNRGKAVVYLHGTTVEGVDMSIFEQPYEIVVDWFKNRSLGQTHPLNEIKVVFLGDGEAGKSHTIARLMNDGGDPVDYTDQSTPGIVIRNKEYDLGDRKITVHYWDFGGQEIMHSMHRIFLTGRTMYVVLLNARDDTQSERAKYWLHNIKSFAPGAPVLLVLNKIDQNENASVNEVDLRSRYGKLTRIVRLSAKEFSRKEFNERFKDVLLEEIRKTGFLDAQWPNSWTQVKERLEKMKSHYIKGDAYEDICRECQVDKNQENLLHWFNDLGISFCCRDENDYALKDYVILRPDWITNALYIILFNRLEGVSNGLIPHRSIFEVLSAAHNDPAIRCTLPTARYNAGDIQYVLGIMRKFSLSFPHGTDHEFIPMLCQQNSIVDVQPYLNDTSILEFNMEFDYLPNNLLHRLMVERCTELDMTTVWRTGARFALPELGYSAVVVIDGNALRFFIRHTEPMHRPNTYLTMLKAHVDRIVEKMGLKAPGCQLIYKLDGRRDAFDFLELKMLQEVGQKQALSKAWRKMIPIVDILNQSAPDRLDDERKLLKIIIQACGNIQDDPIYRLVPRSDGQGYVNGQGMEDLRNRRIRDNLINTGYRMNDQTQRGVSSTGKSVGELDMLVYNDSNEPWTIIEALRVSDKDKSEWNKHLKKLSDNYNTRGFPVLYLLTYVDADTTTFAQIWQSYREHVKTYHPGLLTYSDGSFAELDVPNHQFIKAAKCRYSGGVDPITVYHIFARIPTRNG